MKSAVTQQFSFEEDTKAVAFIDILGFSHLVQQSRSSAAGLALSGFVNAIFAQSKSMRKSFPREVPTQVTGKDLHYKENYVWYRAVPEGSVNFVYVSDSAVIYSNSITHLFQEVSFIFGAAITHAVPIRGAIAIGSLHHLEHAESPGTGISLFGTALVRAVELERKIRGAGMRVWLDEPVADLAMKLGLEAKIGREDGCPSELRWWLDAYQNGATQKTENVELQCQFDRWFEKKSTKEWFTGKNLTNTKRLIKRAVKELQSLGR
jgi:hypothetical protein